MKSGHIRRLMYFLMMCVGAGAGAALAFLLVQLYGMAAEGSKLPLFTLVLLYGALSVVGLLAGCVLAPRVIDLCSRFAAHVVDACDGLTMAQMLSMMTGLVGGLVLAALLSQVLSFLGDSMFTLACSAMLYVVLGVVGVTVGKRRTEDFSSLLLGRSARRERRSVRVQGQPKLPDASALMDGRLEGLLHTGFLEGEVLLCSAVLRELQQLAAEGDEARRHQARRALDLVERLKAQDVPPRLMEDAPDTPDAIIARARDAGAALVTTDAAMAKAAALAGVKVLNLNDLACAMRPSVAAGDVVSLRIVKAGREAGQGVGYMDDGTMTVVEGAAGCIGETLVVTVTSVLQTSAGRMVFAKA